MELLVSVGQHSEGGIYPASVGKQVKQVQEILSRVFVIVQVNVATGLHFQDQVADANTIMIRFVTL